MHAENKMAMLLSSQHGYILKPFEAVQSIIKVEASKSWTGDLRCGEYSRPRVVPWKKEKTKRVNKKWWKEGVTSRSLTDDS